MPKLILDSSVILAVLKEEPGAAVAAEFALNAFMSSVNLAEVVTTSLERGLLPEAALSFVAGRNITVVDFGFDDAVLAGRLRQSAPKGVLSLGDRACVATAIRQRGTAVTADRILASLDLGCPIELIR